MNQRLTLFLKNYWILLVIISVKLILQFLLVDPVYELQRDEFLHLDQAKHPAFGYISVPPFTSWISVIIYLLGGGLFWIRLFPALCGAMTIVTAWLIVESLGGKLMAKLLVSVGLLLSILLRINILYQPNSFEIFTWTVIFFLVIKYIISNQDKWLYLLAIAIALGFYNKYNLIFLLLGLTASILLSSHRIIFSKPAFLKALLFAIVLLLPNIVWQVANGLPIFGHMEALRERQLVNNDLGSFLWGQFAFFNGSILLILGALVAFFFYKPFRQYRFVGISFITVILIFIALKAKDYYSIGLYPVLLAFGSVFLEKAIPQKWFRYIAPLLLINMIASFMITVKIIHPVMAPEEIAKNKEAFEKFGVLRWEDGENHSLPQDFADMLGWKEMAQKSLEAYKMLPSEEIKNTLVFCDNYGQAGALNYYNRGKMAEAYSFNTDYIFWLPKVDTIKNILLVGERPEKEITDLFKECRVVGVVENKYSREKGTAVFLLIGADQSFTEKFYKLAQKRKEEMDVF